MENRFMFRMRSEPLLIPAARAAVNRRRREEPLVRLPASAPVTASSPTNYPTDGIYEVAWNFSKSESPRVPQINDSPPTDAASESELEPLPHAARPTRKPSSPLQCECVDVSIPLQQQKWYHGSIKRRRAESLLQQQEKYSFLVRNSEKLSLDTTPYIISMRIFNSHLSHIKIYLTEHGFSLGRSGVGKSFQTVPECIDYYTRNHGSVLVNEDISIKFQLKYSIKRTYRFASL